jgi:ATP-binding cassette, subfamily B, bacterial
VVKGRWEISLILVAGAYLALTFFRGSSAYLSGRWMAYVSEKIAQSIRNTFFDHVQRLSFSYHDSIQTGELIQKATSDVDTLRRLYGEQLQGITRIMFLFIINFTTALVLEWRLALLSIAIVPVMLVVSIYFFGKIHKVYTAFQNQDASLSAMLQENLSGVRTVRAFARQQFEIEKFDDENKARLSQGIKFEITHAYYWPIAELLGGIQSVVCLTAGGIMAINGSLSIGTFVAFLGMQAGLIWPLQQLGRLIARLSTSAVSYSRIQDVLHEKQEELDQDSHDPNAKLQGEIEFDRVMFSYGENAPVLKDITFRARQGEKIALIGAPGSGKTSFVNLLPRFYDHTSGNLKIDGYPIGEYSKYHLRRNIGIVEQEPFLFATDIRSNIAYGSTERVSNNEIESAAKAAAIHESIISFPNGYETIVGERGVTLSGGQKQRIAIARALVKNPAILILDDSTSSVDTETEEDIRSALSTLMKGRTTFIIAHRIQSLMDADQILVFKEGTIAQRGTHEDLIKQPGFYSQIFELQTEIESDLKEQ